MVNRLGSMKWVSCGLTMGGGVLLAANIPTSKYGFICLAGASGLMAITHLQQRDYPMGIYFSCLFLFVDCLGVIRWVL